MRTPLFLILLSIGVLPIDAFAQQRLPAVTIVPVRAHSPLQELGCEGKSSPVRPLASPNPDPMEIPSEDLLEDATLVDPGTGELPGAASVPSPKPVAVNDSFRIAIWGDSHLAANFFTEELVKLLKVPQDMAPNVLIPANMGKAGVRLPLRKTCVSSQWKYEPGYLGGSQAAAPGPALVNMFSDEAGATLAWDVRKDAQSPAYERVRLLYQQTEVPMVVGISVDGDTEQEVTLHEKAGPAVLELVAERPMAQIRLRLIDARFRFHGLELSSAQSKPFVLDVFGYPGATVASWKLANLDYLRTWFAQRPYQLVVLEFGTNEGNGKPFDLSSYRTMLTDSVRNMKTVFPGAACILIAPGDRGVLVRRSENLRKKKGAVSRALRSIAAKVKVWDRHGKRRTAGAGVAVDLYAFSKIHAAIGRVQAEVAAGAGCTAWSMQDAMGGQGHAYQWAQASPPLMAKDLIHFTVAGYRHLAKDFVRDMGWNAASPTP